MARRRARRPEVAGLTSLLALACAAFIGCSSSANTPTDKFIGTWTFDTGSITGTNCTGLQTVNLQGETLTLMKGSMSALVSTLQSGSFGTCTLNLDVNGTIASAPAGQKCTFTVAALGGLMITFDVTAWTVTTTDGVSMTTAATATGEGIAASCTISLMGAGTKHASGADASTGG